jgi:hypothetical protein
VTREEIAAWVARTRAEQGLPRHVEDDEFLREVAEAILEPRATRSPATSEEAAMPAVTAHKGDG